MTSTCYVHESPKHASTWNKSPMDRGSRGWRRYLRTSLTHGIVSKPSPEPHPPALARSRDALSAELREAAEQLRESTTQLLPTPRPDLRPALEPRRRRSSRSHSLLQRRFPQSNSRCPTQLPTGEALASIEEVARLLPIFAAVLRVHEFAELTAPVGCPVCATPEALTPARIDTMRAELGHASNLDQTAAATPASIDRAGETLTALAEFVRAGMPSAGSLSETELNALAAKLQDWGVRPTLVRDACAAATALTDSTQALVTAGREVREAIAAATCDRATRVPD